MSLISENSQPAESLYFTRIADEKFKTEAVVVRFITRLDEIMSQRYTAVVSLISETNADYPEKDMFAKKLASLYGASVNSFSYRTGDYLVCGLSAECISDKYTINKENITLECAKLLLNCIFAPNIKDGKFDEQLFSQKKHQLIDSINNASNNRHAYAVKKARESAFYGEPSSVSTTGTLENAEKLTSEIAAESYRKLLDEAVISISFCGCGNNTEARKLISDTFTVFVSKRKNKALSLSNLISHSVIKPTPEFVTEEIEQAQSKLVMFFKTDNVNIYADKIMSAMFGGTPFSKLFVNVREKMSLCYYCQSGIIDCKAAMLVDSGVEAGNEKIAQDEILRQLDSLRCGDFVDEELENTKRYICGLFRSNYDSAESLNSWYFYQFARGTHDSPDDSIKKIMKLTKDDIINSAKGFKLDTVYTLVPTGGKDDA